MSFPFPADISESSIIYLLYNFLETSGFYMNALLRSWPQKATATLESGVLIND